MCLLIDTSHHKKRFFRLPGQLSYKPRKAERDIECYKVMYAYSGIIRSFVFFNTEWQINKLYTTKLKRPVAFKNEITQGFHASLSPHTDWGSSNVRAIIPKGAKYFFGINEEIVANKMKIVEVLKTYAPLGQ